MKGRASHELEAALRAPWSHAGQGEAGALPAAI